MNINVGDRVQVINGSIDVSNGNIARTGQWYVTGSSMWATVELIDDQWKTGNRWELPSTVTRIKCVNSAGTVVWQVQPHHISPQIIKTSDSDIVQRVPFKLPPILAPTEQGALDFGVAGLESTPLEEIVVSPVLGNAQFAEEGPMMKTSGAVGIETHVISGTTIGQGERVIYK